MIDWKLVIRAKQNHDQPESRNGHGHGPTAEPDIAVQRLVLPRCVAVHQKIQTPAGKERQGVVVTVPALPSLWGRQDRLSEHRRRYSRKSLSAMFMKAGLPLPAVTYFNCFLFPPIAILRWFRRLCGGAESARSDFETNRPVWTHDLLAMVFAWERHFVGRVRFPLGVSLLATARK